MMYVRILYINYGRECNRLLLISFHCSKDFFYYDELLWLCRIGWVFPLEQFFVDVWCRKVNLLKMPRIGVFLWFFRELLSHGYWNLIIG